MGGRVGGLLGGRMMGRMWKRWWLLVPERGLGDVDVDI